MFKVLLWPYKVYRSLWIAVGFVYFECTGKMNWISEDYVWYMVERMGI